jgi:hypothetical protein
MGGVVQPSIPGLDMPQSPAAGTPRPPPPSAGGATSSELPSASEALGAPPSLAVASATTCEWLTGEARGVDGAGASAASLPAPVELDSAFPGASERSSRPWQATTAMAIAAETSAPRRCIMHIVEASNVPAVPPRIPRHLECQTVPPRGGTATARPCQVRSSVRIASSNVSSHPRRFASLGGTVSSGCLGANRHRFARAVRTASRSTGRRLLMSPSSAGRASGRTGAPCGCARLPRRVRTARLSGLRLVP